MASLSHTPGLPPVDFFASPPKTSIQIRGTHQTSNAIEVVDFDLWIDCAKAAKIKSGRFRTGDQRNDRSWDRSTTDDHRGLPAISQDWLTEWLKDGGSDGCWTLRKVVRISDKERRGIKSEIESLARRTAYGGSIDVSFHGLEMEEEQPMSPPQTVEGQGAEVLAEWTVAHLFACQDTSRDHCIMNAMVDHTKGFISLDNPGPSYGMSPFRRAIKPGSRTISEERDAAGVKYSVRQYSRWGSDD